MTVVAGGDLSAGQPAEVNCSLEDPVEELSDFVEG